MIKTIHLLLIMFIINNCSTITPLKFPPLFEYKSDKLHQHTTELILY